MSYSAGQQSLLVCLQLLQKVCRVQPRTSAEEQTHFQKANLLVCVREREKQIWNGRVRPKSRRDLKETQMFSQECPWHLLTPPSEWNSPLNFHRKQKNIEGKDEVIRDLKKKRLHGFGPFQGQNSLFVDAVYQTYILTSFYYCHLTSGGFHLLSHHFLFFFVL